MGPLRETLHKGLFRLHRDRASPVPEESAQTGCVGQGSVHPERRKEHPGGYPCILTGQEGDAVSPRYRVYLWGLS